MRTAFKLSVAAVLCACVFQGGRVRHPSSRHARIHRLASAVRLLPVGQQGSIVTAPTEASEVTVVQVLR